MLRQAWRYVPVASLLSSCFVTDYAPRLLGIVRLIPLNSCWPRRCIESNKTLTLWDPNILPHQESCSSYNYVLSHLVQEGAAGAAAESHVKSLTAKLEEKENERQELASAAAQVAELSARKCAALEDALQSARASALLSSFILSVNIW